MKESKKNSFVLYASQYESIKDLSNDQKALLFDSIFNYVISSEHPQIEDAEVRMAFKFIKNRIDYDQNRYEDICERRREYGRQGGLANGSKSKHKQAKASISKQMVAKASISKQVQANEADNDNDTDTDTDLQESKDSMSKEKKIKLKKEFVPPTVEEVQAYINEKGYRFSAKAFVEYYEADDWHYGQGARKKKMSNWKQACTQWGNNHSDDEETDMQSSLYPRSVEELRRDDECPNFYYFMPWVEKNCPKIWERLNGFPEDDNQYQNMVERTDGGYRMLSYIVLVLERDGWEKYDEGKGFMWVYRKYLETNGLYKG